MENIKKPDAFQGSRKKEAQGRADVWPFITSTLAERGRACWFGESGRHWDTHNFGDFVYQPKGQSPDVALFSELKTHAPENHKHQDRLYFETWSNKSIGRQGWGWTLVADEFFAYCLPSRTLRVFDWPRLQGWVKSDPGRFPEKMNRASALGNQKNDSYYLELPLDTVSRDVGFQEYKVPRLPVGEPLRLLNDWKTTSTFTSSRTAIPNDTGSLLHELDSELDWRDQAYARHVADGRLSRERAEIKIGQMQCVRNIIQAIHSNMEHNQ